MKRTKTKILSVFLSVCMIISCMAGMSVTASAATDYGASAIFDERATSINQGDTIAGLWDEYCDMESGDMILTAAVVTIKPARGGDNIVTRADEWTADADYIITAWERTVYSNGNLGPYESQYAGYDEVEITEYIFTVQSATEQTVDAVELATDTTTWENGDYVVPEGGVTISGHITVNGTVNLTLTEGATLTANTGITLSDGATLNVSGTGTMAVNGSNGNSNSTVAGTGTLVLKSGIVTVTGGNGGDTRGMRRSTEAGGAAINGAVTVNGGTLTATAGRGGNLGDLSVGSTTGAGGAAISGSVTINAGTVTATGGDGGTIGSSGDGAVTGDGGAGIDGSVTINGGKLTVTNGTGGVSQNDGTRGAGGKGVSGTVTCGEGVTQSGDTYEGPTEPATCGDSLEWSLKDGVLTITGEGDMDDFYIVEEEGVVTETTIPWYSHRDEITSVSLPDGLTSIGNFAFFGCENLTLADIPGTVQTIGESAFNTSGLISVTIPENVENIGAWAFTKCKSLSTVTIEGETTVGNGAFASSGVIEVYMENEVAPAISNNVFAWLTSDTTFTIFVPCGSGNSYRGYWNEWESFIRERPQVSYFVWDETNKKLVETVDASARYTVVTPSTTTFRNEKTYVVKAETVVPERITVSGTAYLILCDRVSLEASKGIEVASGSTLIICGQENSRGALNATGEKNFAGIGGSSESECGTIIINGGIVYAAGGDEAAGIGGGEARDGGEVTINGGAVTADGGKEAAGIGGSYNSDGGEVTINGGTVTANGGTYAAGIGGGYGGDGGEVTINGGNIKAYGSIYAAGIGGGDSGDDGPVTINGGIVLATAGSDADAIGAGADGALNNTLTVSDKYDVYGGISTETLSVLTLSNGDYEREPVMLTEPKHSYTLIDPDSSWENKNNVYITKADLPGFVEISKEMAKNWEFPVGPDKTFLIYKIGNGFVEYARYSGGQCEGTYTANLSLGYLYKNVNTYNYIWYYPGKYQPEPIYTFTDTDTGLCYQLPIEGNVGQITKIEALIQVDTFGWGHIQTGGSEGTVESYQYVDMTGARIPGLAKYVYEKTNPDAYYAQIMLRGHGKLWAYKVTYSDGETETIKSHGTWDMPMFNTPTGLTVDLGDTLADVELPTTGSGTWTWEDDTTFIGSPGTNIYKAKFTPNDTDSYYSVPDVGVQVKTNDFVLTYTNEEGKTETCEDEYTVITKDTLYWNGVMVAAGDVTIKHTVELRGNTTIILVDGAKLTIDSNDTCCIYGNGYNLTVYGQSVEKAGELILKNSYENSNGIIIIDEYKQVGGIVTAENMNGQCIETNESIIIFGGTLNASTFGSNSTALSGGGFTVFGGEVNVSTGSVDKDEEEIDFSDEDEHSVGIHARMGIEIYGGKVTVRYTAGRGMTCGQGDINIHGGKVTVSGYGDGIYADFNTFILGGQTTANKVISVGGNIFLGWAEETDSISAQDYDALSGAVVLSKEFILDETGEDATVDNIAGKTIIPKLKGARVRSVSAPSASQLKFEGVFILPEGADKITYAALIATTKDSVGKNLTYENCAYLKGKSNPNVDSETGEFVLSWTRSGVKATTTWYVRPYFKYTMNGKTYKDYGKTVKVKVINGEAVKYVLDNQVYVVNVTGNGYIGEEGIQTAAVEEGKTVNVVFVNEYVDPGNDDIIYLIKNLVDGNDEEYNSFNVYENTATFKIEPKGNITLTPVYDAYYRVVDGNEDKFSKDGSEYDLTVPEETENFKGWNVNGQFIAYDDDPTPETVQSITIIEPTTIETVYDSGDTVEVYVSGGSVLGYELNSYSYYPVPKGAKITLVPRDGQRLAGWREVNSGATYEAAVLTIEVNNNCRFSAVQNTEIMGGSVTGVTASADGTGLTFTADFFAPFAMGDNAFRYVGIIATTKDSVGYNLSYENCSYMKGKSNPTLNRFSLYSLSWTRTNIKEGQTWYVRAYYKYEKDGKICKGYGDVVAVKIIDGKIVLQNPVTSPLN